MKTVIIFLNICLISLLLYYFLTKTNTLIENLENCPTDKRNTIYKQSAETSALNKQVQTLVNRMKRLEAGITSNTIRISLAGAQQKSSTKKIKDGAKEKEEELNELDKGYGNMGGKNTQIPKSTKNFAKAMRSSKETSSY